MSETNGHITKQDLLDMEGRLHGALRADIEILETRLGKLETRLVGDMEKLETRAHAEGIETNLLKEFWKWGRNSDQRIRRVEFSDATSVERISSIEDRVFTLERKIAGSKE